MAHLVRSKKHGITGSRPGESYHRQRSKSGLKASCTIFKKLFALKAATNIKKEEYLNEGTMGAGRLESYLNIHTFAMKSRATMRSLTKRTTKASAISITTPPQMATARSLSSRVLAVILTIRCLVLINANEQ